MNMKFRFEFFDPKRKEVKVVCSEPTQECVFNTQDWLVATLRACDIAKENKWLLLEIETIFIGEKGCFVDEKEEEEKEC